MIGGGGTATFVPFISTVDSPVMMTAAVATGPTMAQPVTRPALLPTATTAAPEGAPLPAPFGGASDCPPSMVPSATPIFVLLYAPTATIGTRAAAAIAIVVATVVPVRRLPPIPNAGGRATCSPPAAGASAETAPFGGSVGGGGGALPKAHASTVKSLSEANTTSAKALR